MALRPTPQNIIPRKSTDQSVILLRMTTEIKTFNELTADELYEILRARSAVFLMEQRIFYLDMDQTDRDSLHVFMRDGREVVAYARLFPADKPGEVHMGRVLTTRRGCGLGKQIVAVALRAAFQRMSAECISIDSQSYVADFYRKFGFRQVSEEFILEDLPHVKMILMAAD